MRDNQRRERLNALIRAELKRDGRLGESIHIGGCEFAVGDRVVARRNDRERAVDNGMRGTVIAVDPTEKDVLVRTDAGAQRRLDAPYVAEHLQHAYALTAHTIQGATVEWAGVVGRPEDFTRNWSYTALSRAREPTELFILDTPTERELDRAEIAPGQARGLRDERTPIERLEAAMRCRDDEDLALDRIDAERTRGPAHLEPAHAGCPPSPARPSLSCRPSSRSFASASAATPSTSSTSCTPPAAPGPRRSASPTSARARIAELEQPARGVLRRRAADSAERALERQRLKLAEGEIAAAAERERNLASSVPDRDGMGGRTPRAPRARRRARRAALEPPPRAPTRRARATSSLPHRSAGRSP